MQNRSISTTENTLKLLGPRKHNQVSEDTDTNSKMQISAVDQSAVQTMNA